MVFVKQKNLILFVFYLLIFQVIGAMKQEDSIKENIQNLKQRMEQISRALIGKPTGLENKKLSLNEFLELEDHSIRQELNLKFDGNMDFNKVSELEKTLKACKNLKILKLSLHDIIDNDMNSIIRELSESDLLLINENSLPNSLTQLTLDFKNSNTTTLDWDSDTPQLFSKLNNLTELTNLTIKLENINKNNMSAIIEGLANKYKSNLPISLTQLTLDFKNSNVKIIGDTERPNSSWTSLSYLFSKLNTLIKLINLNICLDGINEDNINEIIKGLKEFNQKSSTTLKTFNITVEKKHEDKFKDLELKNVTFIAGSTRILH
jgi:hypothetical protein